MTIYTLLLLPIAATTLYIIGDALACAGARRGSRILHRIGCLLVAAAVAGLALLGIELRMTRG